MSHEINIDKNATLDLNWDNRLDIQVQDIDHWLIYIINNCVSYGEQIEHSDDIEFVTFTNYFKFRWSSSPLQQIIPVKGDSVNNDIDFKIKCEIIFRQNKNRTEKSVHSCKIQVEGIGIESPSDMDGNQAENTRENDLSRMNDLWNQYEEVFRGQSNLFNIKTFENSSIYEYYTRIGVSIVIIS